MNDYDTFIQVAPDCPVQRAVAPPGRGGSRTVPRIEYELLADNPYVYTQEELLFAVHVRRNGISPDELKSRRAELWSAFFEKPRSCLRASSLPKRYGWGLHFNGEGKIALCPMEGQEYAKFVKGHVSKVKLLTAMRSKRG